MMDFILKTIGENFPLKELDVGEYAQMKHTGMTFKIRAFEAEGLGHVSAMTASGFFGLMKMDTLMVVPLDRDGALFSYDRVHAMGNDTLLFELYDTLIEKQEMVGLMAVKEKYSYLPEADMGEHWYDYLTIPASMSKKGRKKDSPVFDEMVRTFMPALMAELRAAPAADRETKREKASEYVEGLLSKGGPSTNVFIKGIGLEKTQYLFRKVLFGTGK